MEKGTFEFPKRLPKPWIRHLEQECRVGAYFKGMCVVGRDKRGTVVHLGEDTYKILHNGKNRSVFGNPLVGSKGLDPIFGSKEIGPSAYMPANRIRGSWFTCPELGVGESISVYFNPRTATNRTKCALYKKSDRSFVAETEEKTGSSGATWRVFNFVSLPTVENIPYWIVYWSSENIYPYYVRETEKGTASEYAYNSFPSKLVISLWDRKHPIYCTYTAAPKEWRLAVESTPITGVPVTIDGVEVGATPVSRMVPTGHYKVAAPAEV